MSESNGNTMNVAERMRALATRKHELAPGIEIEYRRVSVEEILAAAKLPPGVLSPNVSEEELRIAVVEHLFSGERISHVFDVVIEKGLRSPRVWGGDPAACPYQNGYVLMEDLTEWRQDIFELCFFGEIGGHASVSAARFRNREAVGVPRVDAVGHVAPDTGAVPEGHASE